MNLIQILSQKINKLIIFTLILAIGLGFFIAPAQAGEIAYDQIGQFGVPATAIYMHENDAYFASNIMGTSEEGKFLRYLTNFNLSLQENSGPYTWYTTAHIRSIVVSKDGRIAYFSGLFTHVNGVERNGMAAVDFTGKLLNWHPQVDGRAYVKFTMSPDGEYIYAYGRFNGENEPVSFHGTNVIKIKTNDAQVMPWQMQGYDNYPPYTTINYLFAAPDNKLYITVRVSPPIRTPGSMIILKVNADNATKESLAAYYHNEVFGGAAFDSVNSKLYFTVMRTAEQGHTLDLVEMNILDKSTKIIAQDVSKSLPIIQLNSDGSKIYVISRESGSFYELLVIDRSRGAINKPALPKFRFIDAIKVSSDDKYLYISGTLEENYDQNKYGKWRPGDIFKVVLDSVESQAEGTQEFLDEFEPLTGTLAKEKDSSTIYLLRYGIKHPIQNAQVFEAHGWRWEDVREYVTLSNYPTGAMIGIPSVKNLPTNSLIKSLSSPNVYVIAAGTKYWISTADLFNQLGYQWDRIRTVSESELNSLTTGPDIITLFHPQGSVIKYHNHPSVFYISNGKKRVFTTEQSFLNHGYNWGMILNINADVTYPDGEAMI